jgi:hypothetical protein
MVAAEAIINPANPSAKPAKKRHATVDPQK